MALVAANDRGHAGAMSELGTTPDEMEQIRAADRRSEGITPDEELPGKGATERSGRRPSFIA